LSVHTSAPATTASTITDPAAIVTRRRTASIAALAGAIIYSATTIACITSSASTAVPVGSLANRAASIAPATVWRRNSSKPAACRTGSSTYSTIAAITTNGRRAYKITVAAVHGGAYAASANNNRV
jgi:hypothetical protein